MASRSVRRAGSTGRSARRKAISPSDERVRYIESSALVAALLERDAAVISALRATGRRLTSALTMAEARRAVVRAGAALRLTAAQGRAAMTALRVFERRCDLVAVTDAVLARVGRPFPSEPVRTLDAVHLATAELLDESRERLTIVTRDDRVRENAKALGYRVVPDDSVPDPMA